MSTSSILLVDDHGLLRRGLRAFIERHQPGATVVEAASAAEAYERLRETPADVVVMDLHLPGEDGIAASAHIRARWPKTRIIMLSGQMAGPAGADGNVRRALLAGVDAFVSKSDGDEFIPAAITAVRKGQCFLGPGPATELARELRRERAAESERKALSTQELAVLKRLAEGAAYKEIAEELGIGVKTVDTYRTRLAHKLDVHSREELVQQAKRLGLTA